MAKLVELFISFLTVGSFSFGGAYSLLPLIENEIVQKHSWVSKEEFLKILGMVEIIPGAISIKFATYTGYKVAGIPGVIVANLGNMITPVALMIIISTIYFQYENNKYVMKAFQGVKFVIIGMIAAVLMKYVQNQFKIPVELFFIAVGIIMVFFFKLNPVLILAIGIVLSLLIL